MTNLFFSTPEHSAWPTVWRRYSKPPNDCEAAAISCSSSWAPAPSARRSANASKDCDSPTRGFCEKHPRERIPAFLAAVDACLVPLRNNEVFKTAVPSKMFEAMAAAKPVILGVEGEAKEILLANQAGLAVRPEDPASMMAAILKLRNDPQLCQALGRNGRQSVMQKYLRRNEAAKYLNLLGELCAGRKLLAAEAQLAMPD